MKICLAKAPGGIARSRIRFRMDSGFYGQRPVRFLDGSGCGYVIVAKEYSPIKAQARKCKFQRLANGWEAGEFYANVHQKWASPRRFVVARRPIPQDPVEAKQLTLFKDPQYVYHVFITNPPMSPWRVCLFYNPRATIEKNNREFLYDYPLGKIPTNTMDSQRCLFPITFIRGQSCSLVQENLFAQRISNNHTRYDTNRFFSFAGKIYQTRQPEYFDVAKRLPSPQRVPTGVKQDPETSSAKEFSFLRVTLSCLSSRHLEKMAF